MPAEPPCPMDKLLGLFELETLDRDLFLANPGSGKGRLFGGLVAAQAVAAACQTVEERSLHSLHAYFLRPGCFGIPIRLVVDRIRDGRSFATRRVVALQGGEAIFSLSASFARPEQGISHQDEMPEAPGPEGLRDWEEARARQMGLPQRSYTAALELRMCDPHDLEPGVPKKSARMIWMRPRGAMPEDPIAHTALLVYASDRTLLSTAGRPHGLVFGTMVGASLDHAVWLHRPPRFDDWVLFAAESPVAHAARGLIHGAMYTRAGTRIASVTQEGLVRIPRPKAKNPA